MANLQDHHKKNFMEVNARLGLETEKQMLKTASDVFAKKDVVVFGADQSSDIVGKTVSVANIAELKKLSGTPYDAKDDQVEYPEKPSKMLKAGGDISDRVREDISKAAAAYILGNPDKVRDYEGYINDAMFPGKAILFSVEDLYIKKGQTVVLGASGEPEIYNFGTITVEDGGQLSVVGNVQLTCQIFTQL